MNVRKPANYGTMYRELTAILAQNLPQMDEIYAIGKVISQRPEKGAAVAAAEYLQANFPDRSGFSPRNVRRMRDFYETYENDQTLLRLAMKIGWTLNVVIIEAELTRDARKWYLEQAREQKWSKAVLLEKLGSAAHLEKSLDESKQGWYTKENDEFPERMQHEEDPVYLPRQHLPQSDGGVRDEELGEKAGLASQFQIESAATSREEIGNPVYPPARRKLAEHGINCSGRAARQLTSRDYDAYDLLIGMDSAKLRDMYCICGGDYAGKMSLLMDHTTRPGDVAGPWYTGDFEATWLDVLEGCQGLLKEL